MLAYVFWHWHDAQIDARTYQNYLTSFHRTLARERPDGFLFSRCLWLKHAAWLGRAGETYEDWSIVQNSAALDPLNEGAVTGACQEPHREVARWTRGNAAGLYRFHIGEAHLSSVRYLYRFNKPADMPYAALFELLQTPVAESAGSLWVRQMNLGPGPEFCLQSQEALSLPASLQSLEIAVEQIWLSPTD